MTKRKKSNQEELINDIYDEEYMEELLEDDEISPEEEAFMMGYNGA
ncbi:MAG: hypothetical protein ABIB47_00710 [Candidatus Woesearchaeota archaeon]